MPSDTISISHVNSNSPSVSSPNIVADYLRRQRSGTDGVTVENIRSGDLPKEARTRRELAESPYAIEFLQFLTYEFEYIQVQGDQPPGKE